ncbi:S-adenosyl-L-methionine-dependent methyltransferase [Hesseltinella vesiculosa]|uniref:S-adenosyl-L-methionine-dependent methyltransferase n=1 Tax=Hesseltinella vesiculosa TaxID=101127 RepID=A0A1X2GIM1_9FUNG|nr:S-adenosyl-L-methionine-dependent methyltransferase [Hesseltinella vesiculosa]
MGAQHSRDILQNDRHRQRKRHQPNGDIQSFTAFPTRATDVFPVSEALSPIHPHTITPADYAMTKDPGKNFHGNPFQRHSRHSSSDAKHIPINPVRHQVVLSEQASPLTSLTSASRLLRRGSRKEKTSSPTSTASSRHLRKYNSEHDAFSTCGFSDDDDTRTYPASSRSGAYSSSYDSSHSMPTPSLHHNNLLARSSILSNTNFSDPASPNSGQFVFDLISQPSLSLLLTSSTTSTLPITPPPMLSPTSTMPPPLPGVPPPKPDSWVYDHSDEREYDRQLRQHYVMKQVLGATCQLDLDRPTRILDIGCGIGLWVWETSQQYPDCHVTGMDSHLPEMQNGSWEKDIVSRLRTNASSGPPSTTLPGTNSPTNVPGNNISFIHGDFLKPLPFDDHSFDFIHIQDISRSVPRSCWSDLLLELYRILKPGAMVQLVEHDGLFKNPGPALALINEWRQVVAMENQVKLTFCQENLCTELQNVDLGIVSATSLDIPIGEWSSDPVQKQHGFLYQEQIKSLFRAIQHWWLMAAGISPGLHERICNEAMDEFDAYKTSVHWNVVTAKKPAEMAGPSSP